MKKFFDAIEKTGNDLQKSVQKTWDDVKVQCPSQACRAVLTVPPGVQVFQCSACGTQVHAPDTAGQVTHHFTRFANSVSDKVDGVMGQTVAVTVVVPEGAEGGQTIDVPATFQGKLQVNAFRVAVPTGLLPGQSFVTQVPASTAKRLSVTATTAAPETVPVAQPVNQLPVGGGVQPVAPAVISPPPVVQATGQSAADAARRNSSGSDTGPVALARTMTDRIEEAGDEINRDLQAAASSTSKAMTDTWNDFNVRCPSCQAVLAVPEGAQIFACGICSTRINRPADTNRVGHHLERFSRRLGQALDVAIDRTVTVQVKVPEGKGPGDVVQVTTSTSNGNGICDVVVPEGMTPGQTFTAQVRVADMKPVPYSSIATAAPEEMPVAEIAVPYVQSPVQPSAQPAATLAQAPAAPSEDKVHVGTVQPGAAVGATDVVVGIPVEDGSLQGASNSLEIAAPEGASNSLEIAAPEG